MTNVDSFGVMELDLRECENVGGGSDWSYALGYTVGVMIAHPYIAVGTAIDYYLGH